MTRVEEPVEAAEATIAAQLLWCQTCRLPRRVRHEVVGRSSFRHRPGLHGESLLCVGCGATIVTCYVGSETAR